MKQLRVFWIGDPSEIYIGETLFDIIKEYGEESFEDVIDYGEFQLLLDTSVDDIGSFIDVIGDGVDGVVRDYLRKAIKGEVPVPNQIWSAYL